MKKLLLSFAVITLAILLVVSACKKGNEKSVANELSATSQRPISADVDPAQPVTQNPVANFYKAYGPKAQKYTVSASEGETIKLPSGGTIKIPAGAFAIDGKAVTSGNVEVSVLDLPDRGAMALSGVNTMVGAKLLESNGNFEMQANVNGQAVDRELAKNIRVNVPDRIKNGKPLNLFEGGQNAVKQFDWVPVRVPGQNNGIPPTPPGIFDFDWGTLGWCNPDWYWSDLAPGTAFTTLQVDLPNNPGTLSTYMGGTGNTVVLFVPQGRNIVIHIYTANPGGVISYPNSIPVGVTGRLLAYSVTSGSHYMATKDITTTSANPIVESLTFAPTTPAALTAALSALSGY